MSYNFTWVQGRRLETVASNGNTFSYTYNADGIRTSKTVDGVKREYILNGTQILGETWSDGTTIVYIYDAEGAAIGMLYRESTYSENTFDAFFYERNLMGDVIAVYSADGTKLISYAYDAWGNVSTTYATTDVMFTGPYYNPFTYRGYYRDAETGFYYLNSRYYDPKVGRFINPDSFVSTGQGLTGYNMFAYCGNNPVMRADESGQGWFKKLVKDAVAIVTVAFVTAVNAMVTNSNTNKAIKESNYKNNMAAENNPDAVSTRNQLIKSQSATGFADHYEYGLQSAKENGCEVIAVHNVKVTLGIDSTFGDTALQFQSVGGMWLYGFLGSTPQSIGMVLKMNGIDYSMVSANEITDSGTYVVVYWSSAPKIHTAMIHNGITTNGTYSYDSDTYKQKLICAYKIN